MSFEGGFGGGTRRPLSLALHLAVLAILSGCGAEATGVVARDDAREEDGSGDIQPRQCGGDPIFFCKDDSDCENLFPDAQCEVVACMPYTNDCGAQVQGCFKTDELKAAGAPCDDGNSCTVGDKCDAGGSCAGEEKECLSFPEEPVCGNAICSQSTGECFYPKGKACDDGHPCTMEDQCDGEGFCSGKEAKCDDGNSCTTDYCDPLNGCEALDVPDNQSCDDGNVCTVKDKCSGGKCGGEEKDCDDEKQCTKDYCDPEDGCKHSETSADGEACDDGDPDTVGDKCMNGECKGTDLPTPNCDDGKDCTEDALNENGKTCENTPKPKGALCDVGDACALSYCDGQGNCVVKGKETAAQILGVSQEEFGDILNNGCYEVKEEEQSGQCKVFYANPGASCSPVTCKGDVHLIYPVTQPPGECVVHPNDVGKPVSGAAIEAGLCNSGCKVKE